MRYVGFINDEVYTPLFTVPAMTLGLLDISEAERILDRIRFNENIPITNRIFIDEVRMCTGVPAFNRMEKIFKESKHEGKWEAWQAWRRLV